MQKRIKLRFTKAFQREVDRLNSVQTKQLYKRLKLFEKNPFHPQLNYHKLHGDMKGFYSINITGDIRAVYFILDENNDERIIGFTRLGTHSQLY